MSRSSSGELIRCIAVAVLFSIVLYVGCKPTVSAKPPASPSTESKQAAPAAFLRDWKKPAVALVLSGEEHGYLEPCGCTELQSGGVARRADLVRMLDEKGWNAVGMDVGGLVKRSRRQDEIKFEKFCEAFQHMHYLAIGVGVEELKLGAEFLLAHKIDNPDELLNAAALVSANVEFFDAPDLGWPLPSRLIEKGGVKIGVTSIIAPSLRDKVAPEGVNTNIKILDPDTVLPKVIKSLEEAKPDFMVLLCHGKEADAMQMAKTYPQFRIVLAAGGYEEPDGKPIKVDNTWVLYVGHKGKRVGVLGYYPDNRAEPFKFELIQLDKERFKNDPAMRELMRHYQQQLQDEDLAASEACYMGKHPTGNTFVGAEKCGTCHTKAYAHWKETGHAAAFTTLKEGPWSASRADEKVGWIPRQFDPECLSCHVTGWHPQEMLRYESGYVREKDSPLLLGQQCENCHGPGSAHVNREENSTNNDELVAERMKMRRTLDQAKKATCVECHDPDNSPKFTPERFNEFWEKVKHPWKD